MTVSADPLALAHAAPPTASGPTAWWRATRSEARRLLRPSFAGTAGLLLAAFAVMTTLITFLAEVQGPGLGAVRIDPESARGIVAPLATASSIMGIVVLACWAVAAASDISSGWIRVMVQAEPRRWALLAGKMVALASLTVVGAALATLVVAGLAPVVAQGAGVVTDAWWPDLVGTLLGGWVDLTLALLAWGVIGLAVAVIARSATVAIAGGIGYLLVFEGLLRLIADGVTTYLPGSVLNAVAAGGTADLAWGTAVALTLGYMVAATAAAAVTFIRRDITA